MRISDWSSDVCSSDLIATLVRDHARLDADFGSSAQSSLAMGLEEGSAAGPLDISRPQWRVGRRDRFEPFDTSATRSEEHTSELQSLMRISYAVFCLKTKHATKHTTDHTKTHLYILTA